ncbi:MAG: Glucose-6-phosphate isomerase (EC [uncultured Thiotrichaceae bacterium]|uniref:Glucose-6-phosphate isomerase n=1 Tax=uncultured Thiotrichaceae bacterium TaxID=298394 RepID=A0A6S6S6I9_9GAMM|nr:MAG: Glucose-6-phosphate isomerase (EC [uncultured Thiotrichaceae bacterium]
MRSARVISNIKSSLVQTPAWQRLVVHHNDMQRVHMMDLFKKNPNRFNDFSLQFEGILLDYSKNIITSKTMDHLFYFARKQRVKEWRHKMFTGGNVNNTEGRAVLHTALRNRSGQPVMHNGKDVMPDVLAQLDKMRAFTDNVRSGEWKGYTGKPITNIINIGIGGSDLGPNMACRALCPFADGLRVHFVSNVDATQLSNRLAKCNPETTLFIVASKTFTTQETITNAESSKNWFLAHPDVKQSDVAKHFVAISTNKEKVEAFGIDPVNMFEFWDWVGGRYSLWSTIGLSIALYIGMDQFIEMLEGAHAMDEHFLNEPFDTNMPVILAMIGIWYGNFFGAESSAILPYDHNLRLLPAYLEQADMESNGKSVDRDGRQTTYSTGKIIWGAEGINGQHAFYQLLHQGTLLIPTDFIASVNNKSCNLENHGNILASNFIAQTEALMRGRDAKETRLQLRNAGIDMKEIEMHLPHMTFQGNQPSNSIVLDSLTPRSFGSLIAMYEHKIFVQGIIWNLNSYDQWGVELGKKLARNILDELEKGETLYEHDSSTEGLLQWFFNRRK